MDALAPTGAMASILPDSDTTSASSDVSPSPSQLYYHHYYRSQSPTRQLNDPTTPTSNVQHSRSQTLSSTVSASSVSLPLRLSGPIKRKPVSSSASSIATHYIAHGSRPQTLLEEPDLARPDQRFAREPPLDSPTLYEYPRPTIASVVALPPPPTAEASSEPSESKLASIHGEDDDATPTVTRNNSTDSALAAAETAETDLSDVLAEYDDLISDLTAARSPDPSSLQGQDESSDNTSDIDSVYADNISIAPSSPMFASKPAPPNLRLEKVDQSVLSEEGPRTHIDDSPSSSALAVSPQLNKPLPKSPSQLSPLASFFGWGNPSPSVTDFSSVPSPLSPAKPLLVEESPHSSNRSSSANSKPDAANNAPSYESYLATSFPLPPTFTKAITNPITATTHQPYSPSAVEEMEEELKAIGSELAASIRREIDLEDLADRLQEQINNPQAPGKRSSDYFSDSGYSSAKFSEYEQSREEIEKIQRKSDQEKAQLRLELTEKLQDERNKRKDLDQKIRQLQEKASEVELVQINNLDTTGRIKDLENTCEDLRRKLSEERQSKSGFEDLLAALKTQLQEASDERDNLRDEVVPELRARVEGMEAEAAEYVNMTYESSRMQHELHSLKKENRSLRNSMVSGPEDILKRTSMGLSRSNSVATGSYRGQRPTFGLNRSDSVKNAAQNDSRDVLLDRLKDVEAQRDALHSALKSLLERHEFNNRQNQKKIRLLENERQRLLSSPTRKGGYERDVAKLRSEVSILRRRAEDALEQKWQVEKGLGGLKMDLDRAEEEVQALRSLLKEKDILIPPSLARSSGSSDSSQEPVTSESLQAAYDELQSAYAESLERIQQLEEDADAEHAQELNRSTARIEELASKVQKQLEVNGELRERLSAAVHRGETERKSHTTRISEMQERLRHLEDQVVTAQTASEDRVAQHEEEISKLREAHNEQLRRLSNGQSARPSHGSLLTSGNTIFGRSNGAIPTKSIDKDDGMKSLRARVAELEKALSDTESEMQEVVAKMNMAQVDVLNLQEDREQAVRETRRLEQLLKQEQSKASGGYGFFSALSGKA